MKIDIAVLGCFARPKAESSSKMTGSKCRPKWPSTSMWTGFWQDGTKTWLYFLSSVCSSTDRFIAVSSPTRNATNVGARAKTIWRIKWLLLYVGPWDFLRTIVCNNHQSVLLFIVSSLFFLLYFAKGFTRNLQMGLTTSNSSHACLLPTTPDRGRYIFRIWSNLLCPNTAIVSRGLCPNFSQIDWKWGIRLVH